MFKYICILFLLVGCQSVPTPSLLENTTTTDKNKIVVDQDIMKDCGKLISLPYPTTFESILEITSRNFSVFVECKKQNAAKKKLLQDYVIGK